MSNFGDMDNFVQDLLRAMHSHLAIKLRPNMADMAMSLTGVGPHVEVDVFVGVDMDHLQLTGRLVMEHHQFLVLQATLCAGSIVSAGQVDVAPLSAPELVKGTPPNV